MSTSSPWPPEKAWWYPDGEGISPQEKVRALGECSCEEVRPGVRRVCARCQAIIDAANARALGNRSGHGESAGVARS